MRQQEVMVDTDRERMRWYTSQADELWNAIAFYSPLAPAQAVTENWGRDLRRLFRAMVKFVLLLSIRLSLICVHVHGSLGRMTLTLKGTARILEGNLVF